MRKILTKESPIYLVYESVFIFSTKEFKRASKYLFITWGSRKYALGKGKFAKGSPKTRRDCVSREKNKLK